MPSTIEWTDETWNPVTGCSRVSPGCDNCYMFALYPRLRAMAVPGYETAPDTVRMLPERLRAPLSWRRPRRVFVNSMSDLFHPHVEYDFISDVFVVMRDASQHVFQVLTKRPGRAAGWWELHGRDKFGVWPENVWMGTSVESQKYAPRLSVLRHVPAAVRFVSAEPLLERVDLTQWLEDGTLHWVIAGGESGPRARPMALVGARSPRPVNKGKRTLLPQAARRNPKQTRRRCRSRRRSTLASSACRNTGDRVTQTSFGGDWTLQKLEILKRYLDAYTTALKKMPFNLMYLDAFAGEGYWSPKSAYTQEDYGDFNDLLKGSASIALDVQDKPFDRLIFIEKAPERCESLSRLRTTHPNRNIEVISRDANIVLPKFCADMEHNDRAVVFLDPFKTEVSWATIEAIASTQKIDCWILFPLMAITRMMPVRNKPPSTLSPQLDRVFGGSKHWKDFYSAPIQQSLFGGEQPQQRASGSKQIADRYRERLAEVFEKVAPTRRQLTNSMNSPMFELFFAAGNPQGAPIAVRIADHILKNW